MRLFTPSTDDLSQLLSWIGGFAETELIPLNSLRSRIARKLLSNFPWEAVDNAVGFFPFELLTSLSLDE